MRREWRRIHVLATVAALLVAIAWGVQFTARASPGLVPSPPASPLAAFEGDLPVADSNAWTLRRAPLLRSAFVERIYGAAAPIASARVEHRSIDASALERTAELELLTLHLEVGGGAIPFQIALLTPKTGTHFPLLVLPVFCGLDSDVDARLPSPAWRAMRCRTGFGRAFTQVSHGDAILHPPLRAMIARGYAVAVFYAGDVAPDDPVLFGEAPIHERAGDQRGGAIAAWASLYLSAFEALRTDPRISPSRIAFWGHSRYGKAALLAAALEPRVGAVIANQSGTFGATLSSATRGESAMQIVRRFPHWFSASLTSPPLTNRSDELDQHLLLALLAPRPLLLGNAALDRWSDPAASFAAARSASEAYSLFARPGLAQRDMRSPDLTGDIAFYVRPGGHGVRSSDWDRALDFLDIHFAVDSALAAAAPRGA